MFLLSIKVLSALGIRNHSWDVTSTCATNSLKKKTVDMIGMFLLLLY